MIKYDPWEPLSIHQQQAWVIATQMTIGDGFSLENCSGDDLKSMWEKLQDFDLEFQVKACDVASLSDVQDHFFFGKRLRDGPGAWEMDALEAGTSRIFHPCGFV